MKTKNKIWLRLFLNIACVFLIFVLCVALAGSTLFEGFYTEYEKGRMRSCARQVAQIDLNDQEEATLRLQTAESEYNVAITIYNDDIPVYSTLRRPAGAHRPDIDGFDMLINRGETNSNRDYGDDGEFSIISGGSDRLLVYTYADGGMIIELMMEQSLINNSADAAGRFMLIIAAVCLVGALVWSIVFARRFTRPIEQMNSIAVGMANLDFSRKVEIERDDELGHLGKSLNELSASLDRALGELNERNRSLQNEIDAERRLDEMRRGFVANVSHELKTPISIIQGYAEGLVGGMAEDDRQRSKYCDVILDESRRMNKLVLSLLELSRYESGVDSGVEQFDLAASLINIADRNSAAMKDKGVCFDMAFPESMMIEGDRMLTEQVIQNYLQNAVSHVPHGGTIRLYTEPYGEDGMRVCVYNSGSKVEPDEMESIWQSFWRADKSHNRAQGRFGLGLSIVKAIMTSANLDFGLFNTDDGVTFWAQVSAGRRAAGGKTAGYPRT